MYTVDVNYGAVLVGALIYMVIGAVWYSPVLFAKAWMKEVGKSEKEVRAASTPTMYVWTFVAELVAVYILTHFIRYVGATTLAEGAITGFWAWLGFSAATALINGLFSGKSRTLFFIDQGYHLVALVLAGAILAVWR